MYINTGNNLMVLGGPKMEDKSLKVDFIQLRKAALSIRALNHAFRQELLKLINECQRITVTELVVKLGKEQSVVSLHLAVLRRAGLVRGEKIAKYVYYTVNLSRIAHVMQYAHLLNTRNESEKNSEEEENELKSLLERNTPSINQVT